MNAYMNQYQNNQVTTATPEQVLIMLYDGAIRFVRQAKEAVAAGNLGAKSTAISKTIAIITEFSNTLDRKIGGEIAVDLSRLYDFMLMELSSVNVHGDVKRLDPVEKILLDLREAFAEAAIIHRREQQAAQPAGAETQRSVVAY